MSGIAGYRKRRASPKSVVLWGLLSFALVQASFYAAMECWPTLRDPEYGSKLCQLQNRIAENPVSRPLIVVMGSSRISFGLRLASLTDHKTIAKDAMTDIVQKDNGIAKPLTFNFGIAGLTPSEQLMCLQRLLSDGIHPDLLLVEFTPVLMMTDQWWIEHIDINRLRLQDVRLLASKVNDKPGFCRQWCRAQLVPCYYHRYLLMNYFLPSWLHSSNRTDTLWEGIDAYGWVPAFYFREKGDPKAWHREIEHCRPYIEKFAISEIVDSAFQAVAALCREKKIRLALMLTPEGSGIRSLYPASAMKTRNEYLRRFAEQNQCGIIDATAWLSDEDFVEGCHETHTGATVFAKRFEQEVIRPFTDGGAAMIANRMDIPAVEKTTPVVARNPEKKDSSIR